MWEILSKKKIILFFLKFKNNKKKKKKANRTPDEVLSDTEYEKLMNENEDFFPQIPDNCDNEYASLIKDCWEEDPFKRPNIFSVITRLKEMEYNLPKN